MASQQANQDKNKIFGLLGHSSTADTSETRRVVVDKYGGLGVSPNGLIRDPYDYVTVGYPNGTTEVYSFYDGGTAGDSVGTITLTYLDTNKGTLSTVLKE
jgi:hypothetical protein